MRRWPQKEHDIVCGDINAHSLLWDDSKRTDKRGRIVEEWLADSNMLPLNDGTPTHTNRSSGTESAPDVTLVHSTLMDKMTWERVEDLSSDYHPIIITYRDNIPRVNDKPVYKWKLKEANWDSYREEIEKSIHCTTEERTSTRLRRNCGRLSSSQRTNI